MLFIGVRLGPLFDSVCLRVFRQRNVAKAENIASNFSFTFPSGTIYNSSNGYSVIYSS